MIKIDKTGKRPTILIKQGADKGKDKLLIETEKLKKDYLSNPAAYKTGKKKFSSDIYAHEDIKPALIEIQNGKCCFCESRITHITYGDVEHFRPKKAWTTISNRKYNYPGYYWLAYDWDNLFLSCQLCNQRYKRNMFPLVDESKRTFDHTCNLDDEEPLFVHPEKLAPEDHITFEGAFIKVKDGSLKGEATIKSLDLERIELYETRNEIYQLIEKLIKVYKLIPDIVPESVATKIEVRDELRKVLKPEYQYLNMIRANFGKEIQKILDDAI